MPTMKPQPTPPALSGTLLQRGPNPGLRYLGSPLERGGAQRRGWRDATYADPLHFPPPFHFLP